MSALYEFNSDIYVPGTTSTTKLLVTESGLIQGPLSIVDTTKPGEVLFDIQGSAGQLFSITDSLEGLLFSVNDISGLPIFEVHSDDRAIVNGDLTSGKFIKDGGTSTEILLADGTVTSLTDLQGDYVKKIGDTMTGPLTVANIDDTVTTVISVGGITHTYYSIERFQLGRDTFGGGNAGIKFWGNTGIYTRQSNSKNLYFQTDSLDRMTLDLSGNLGIGTITPTEKLDVVGNVLATSFIKSGGTSTEILLADGTVTSLTDLQGDYVKKIGDNMTGPLTINSSTTDNIFELWGPGNVKRTQVRSSGIQEWWLNSGAAEVGNISYSTPNGSPGIVFFNAAGLNRSQFRLSSGGGLEFGFTSGNGAPTSSIFLEAGGYVRSVGFKKTGGTSAQFLKADGSIDTTTYYHSGNLPTYDNYGSWNLKSNGVQRTTIGSGGIVDLVAGTNMSISYGAGGVMTFNSTEYTSSNGILLTGTNFAPTYGTTANTIAQGNDSRLSDNRFPSNDSDLVHKSGTETITGKKTFNAGIADVPTEIGYTSQSYRNFTTLSEWQLTVGGSRFVQSISISSPGSAGYWNVTGRRDAAGGYSGIYTPFGGTGNNTNAYIGYTIDGTIAPTWDKIWTDRNLTNVSQLNNDAGYITEAQDNQTLSWTSATGALSISGGNSVNLDGRYSLLAHNHDTEYLAIDGQDNIVKTIDILSSNLPADYTEADVAAYLNTVGFTKDDIDTLIITIDGDLADDTQYLKLSGGIMSGDIIPDIDNVHSLGSATKMWKDIYVGPGSLYVNGKKVIEDVSDTMNITTSLDQNLAIKTSGIGSLQISALGTGNIELNAVNGLIQLKGSTMFQAQKLIRTTDGTPLLVDDDINFSLGAGISSDLDVSGAITGASIAKTGGLSTQFLKADGSIDSSTYLTAETDTLQTVTNRDNSTSNPIIVSTSGTESTAVQRFGIEINRSTGYFRPISNADKNVYFGGATKGSLDWLNINFYGTGVFMYNDQSIYHAGNLTNVSQLTNDAGYTTPSGHTHTFASLTSKPTTISGYGITNAVTNDEVKSGSILPNNISIPRNVGSPTEWIKVASFGSSPVVYKFIISHTGDNTNCSDELTVTAAGYSMYNHIIVTNSNYNSGKVLKYKVTGSANSVGVALWVQVGDIITSNGNLTVYGSTTLLLDSNTSTEPVGLASRDVVITRNPNSTTSLIVSGGIQVNDSDVWHAGNLTNVSQLTNDAGYITEASDNQTLTFVNGDLSISAGNTVDLDSRFLQLTGGIISGDLTTTSQIILKSTAPQIKFEDNDGMDFWLHTNSNNFYILNDRLESGSWDAPYALQLEADTNKSFTFGNEIWHKGNLTNVSQLANDAGYITEAGDNQTLTFTNGDLSISAGNTVDLDARFVQKAGDTMTGPLLISGTSSGNYKALIVGSGLNGSILTRHIDGKHWSDDTYADLYLNQYSTGDVIMSMGGGKVGIGTTSPTRKLEVSGGSTGLIAHFKGTLDNSYISFGNSLSGADQIRVGSRGTSLALATNYVDRLTIDNAGNVGIGTTTPTAKLEIFGSTPGALVHIRNQTSTGYAGVELRKINNDWGSFFGYQESSDHMRYNVQTGYHNFLTNSIERVRITNAGNVGIGNANPTNKLDVFGIASVTSLRLGSSGSGEGLIRYDPGSGNGVGITTGAIDSGSIGLFVSHPNNSSNVGIGTTTPVTKLDVVGDVQIVKTDTPGETIFDIQGSAGQLFSITDSLEGDLFSVNDISGLPILTVNSEDRVEVNGILNINSGSFTGLTTDTTIKTIEVTGYDSAHFDYMVKRTDVTGSRAGSIIAIWNGTNVEWTDTSTSDLDGVTSGIEFSVDIVAGEARLRAIITSGTWSVKAGARTL